MEGICRRIRRAAIDMNQKVGSGRLVSEIEGRTRPLPVMRVPTVGVLGGTSAPDEVTEHLELISLMSSPGEAYASRNGEASARLESATGLATLLTVDRVQLGRAVRDWREALRVASLPLIRNGDLAPEYLDAMIRMVETLGPYIVVAPGVALAHARPENGASRVCIGIAVLRTTPCG